MNLFQVILSLVTIWHCHCEEFISGADYLQTAIRDIIIKNSERNIAGLIETQATIATPTPVKRVRPVKVHFDKNRRFSGGDHHHPEPLDTLTAPSAPSAHASPHPPHPPHPHHIPDPPSLTKGELAALYEAAVSAGHGINLDGIHNHGHGHGHDSTPVQAAVHEIKEHHSPGDDHEGYYYYYYPLKTFMDMKHTVPKDHYKPPVVTSYNTHLHNVKVEPIQTIAPTTTEAPSNSGKAIEPLFMAISSFVGMAVMFVFTMVLWPKFTGIKNLFKKPGPKSKNNFRPNPKNNPNKKKKTRILEGWPKLIADYIDVNCKGCDSNLGPYRFWINRNSSDVMRNKSL